MKLNSKRNFNLAKITLACIFYIILCSHSGRTDSNGGHYNRSTGEYHYHNGKHKHHGGHDNNNSGIGFLVFGGAIGSLILIGFIKSKIDENKDK